jgi:hypothetical protein
MTRESGSPAGYAAPLAKMLQPLRITLTSNSSVAAQPRQAADPRPLSGCLAVLLDAGHRRWFLGTLLAALILGGVYWWLYRASPDGLTGGSTVGLWYGIGGSLLMVYAGLLAAHRKLARWRWLPRRSWMLKGHIWLGLLSFVLILCHSGCRWGGTLEGILWVVFGLTLLTGVVGLALQHFLPRLLSLQIVEETPYGQMPYTRRQILVRADALIDGLSRPLQPASGGSGSTSTSRLQLRASYERDIRPFLKGAAGSAGALANTTTADEVFARLRTMSDLASVQGELATLETLCDQYRQLAEQERLHHWLHVWLLLHVPLSVALLVLGVAHAVMSLYY